ncbi:MAG: hypothetical protein R3358_02670 [Woeseiaceae bacterium]|nr:hypothetical protein [Woeseiaceae bacterium]
MALKIRVCAKMRHSHTTVTQLQREVCDNTVNENNNPAPELPDD